MLLPPHPTLCNISTASIGCVGLSLGNRELGCQWGVLGVCRLTGAQAAICHPTLASLIFIPNPAWPSRPAVSSPQKGFPLGGGCWGDKGREELWGGSTARPFDLVPGLAGQTAQTDSTVSAPCLLLSFISHTDPGG